MTHEYKNTNYQVQVFGEQIKDYEKVQEQEKEKYVRNLEFIRENNVKLETTLNLVKEEMVE